MNIFTFNTTSLRFLTSTFKFLYMSVYFTLWYFTLDFTTKRFLASYEQYKVTLEGDVDHTLTYFAGILEEKDCISHCGCHGTSYAGWVTDKKHCFCGNELGTKCLNSGRPCIQVCTNFRLLEREFVFSLQGFFLCELSD